MPVGPDPTNRLTDRLNYCLAPPRAPPHHVAIIATRLLILTAARRLA